jgi:hypothetical protein
MSLKDENWESGFPMCWEIEMPHSVLKEIVYAVTLDEMALELRRREAV